VASTGQLPVTGWIVDTTAQGWSGVDDVQIFLGSMEAGSLLAHATLGLNRPDVSAALNNPFWSAAGWSAVVDGGSLPPNQASLYIYAHTPAKGWWFSQVAVTVAQAIAGPSGELLAPAPALAGSPPSLTVTSPREGEFVSTRIRTYAITGTARDPSNGARGIDWVEVWLNGEANADRATLLGTAELAADGTWTLNFDPAAHDPINSNLYAYAHSAVTGKRSLVVTHFAITDRPPH
jgi:hypothetical protein